MNLVTLLERHAAERGEKAALIQPGRPGKADGRLVTYEELRDDVARMAVALAERGLGPGDRVLVFVPMSIDLYVLLLGILHLGAVAVFVEPGMGRARIGAALDLAEPTAFAAIPRAHLLRFVSPSLRRVRTRITLGGGRLARMLSGLPADRPPAELEADAPAMLTFTSGSTGQPKGALRSHAFLLTQHEALAQVMHTAASDVEMPALPIFLLNSLAAGATAVIPPIGARVADVDPVALASAIRDHDVTTSAGSPALYRPLADYATQNRVTFPSIHSLFLGGAPVPPRLLADLEPLLPNGRTIVVYGSTEAEPIAHLDGATILRETAPRTARGEGLCVGRPVDCVRVRLEDEEILVAGDHVNRSYYRNARAVKEHKVIDADGTLWHRTGDLGRFDDDGRLWLLGRATRVVERAGRRVYPFAVELAARSRSGITQAALLEVSGKVVLAVEGEGADTDLLALNPHIDEVRVVQRIPTDRRHNAKVDYEKLRKLFA